MATIAELETRLKALEQEGRTTWPSIVGRLPAQIFHWTAIVALGTVVLLIVVTLAGYVRGDAITIANLKFGRTEPATDAALSGNSGNAAKISISDNDSEKLTRLSQHISGVYSDRICFVDEPETGKICLEMRNRQVRSFDKNGGMVAQLGK